MSSSRPQALVRSIQVLAGAEFEKKLGGGPVSDSWLLKLDGDRMVLRIDKPLAGVLRLDRATELALLSAVHQAGFGPEVIWADRARGMLLTRYIHGTQWTKVIARKPENIRRLAIRLREIHSTTMIVAPVLDIEARARSYAAVTNSVLAKDLLSRLIAIAKTARDELTEVCFCHNDPGYRNIIDAGKILLLDWEYAAHVSRWFDLAGVVLQNGYGLAQTRVLLQAYYGQVDLQLEERLGRFRQLYALMSALWCTVVCAVNGNMENRRQLQAALNRLQAAPE